VSASVLPSPFSFSFFLFSPPLFLSFPFSGEKKKKTKRRCVGKERKERKKKKEAGKRAPRL
jgi:hypothetical protein